MSLKLGKTKKWFVKCCKSFVRFIILDFLDIKILNTKMNTDQINKNQTFKCSAYYKYTVKTTFVINIC